MESYDFEPLEKVLHAMTDDELVVMMRGEAPEILVNEVVELLVHGRAERLVLAEVARRLLTRSVRLASDLPR